MTRVDFYVSPNQAIEANLQLACRIAEKAYSKNNSVYMHVQDPQQAKRLDDLLWIFRDGSFVPHCQSLDKHASQAAVVIGHGELPEITPDVLINLADEVPNFFTRFTRVAEIVSGAESARNIARSHFKFYRERGYPLETHELNS